VRKLKALVLLFLFCVTQIAPVLPGLTQSKLITGRLHVVGNEPFTRLVCRKKSGGSYIIEGELLGELRNLQGAIVRLEGEEAGKAPEYGISILIVKNYRVLSINGKNPLIGVLALEDDRLFLIAEDGKIYILTGNLHNKLKDSTGAKVWVNGKVKGSLFSWITKRYKLSITSFGVIIPVNQ